VRIRRLAAEEWAALRDLRLRALADAPSAFASTLAREQDYPRKHWQENAADLAEGDDSSCYVAESDGELQGMAIGFRDDDDPSTVWLVAMWVAPEMRCRGVAAGLAERVVAWASETGAARVLLWVNRENADAVRVYERVGFAATGERKPLPSDPTQVEAQMARTLR
jgi:GNAT superfamily N-acetyltransferase